MSKQISSQSGNKTIVDATNKGAFFLMKKSLVYRLLTYMLIYGFIIGFVISKIIFVGP